MTLRSYIPPIIRCKSFSPAQQPVTEACATILSTMQATEEKLIFGPAGASGVQEVLPRLLTDRKKRLSIKRYFSPSYLYFKATGRCSLYIRYTPGFSDRASWYDLWAAAVAVDGMCARSGKTGKAYLLGKMQQKQS